MEGLMKGFYTFSLWVARLAYVNILWIFFTIAGLVVLGFYPATTAMFAVVRKWVLGDCDIPVFKTFWSNYKKEFVKSNILGIFISIFAFIMYSSLNIISSVTIPPLKVLYIPNGLVTLLFLLTVLYIFPVFVHYDVKLTKVAKNAFIIMTINPISTFCMVVLTGFLLFIIYKFPGLIPFFSGSMISFLLMFLSNYAFNRASKVVEIKY
ncbi:YesL family protein [Metabacillus niabensis]|uniref:YesL family protein n=1 Tax=Metabacillus niabensis TaxID=324854 RepID=UPI001CFA43B7|nr:YesL family protein [Metabacillus niabensis]